MPFNDTSRSHFYLGPISNAKVSLNRLQIMTIFLFPESLKLFRNEGGLTKLVCENGKL